MTSQHSFNTGVWIEYYEDEKLSDAEKRLLSEGFVYYSESGKWKKTEDSIVTQVGLIAQRDDVWVICSVYDEAYETSTSVDMVTDTFAITGSIEKSSEEPEHEAILMQKFYSDTAQYLKDIDWKDIGTRITDEEYQTLQKFLPILNGEAFTWIYLSPNREEENTYTHIHAKKQVNIREMLADQMVVRGLEQVEPIVDSFCFADVFQSGSENLILCLRNMGYEWLILHEENGVIYGIDMYISWFMGVQKEGLYFSSTEADRAYYHRMKFVDGDYIVEDVGTVIREQLFIDGLKKSDAEYEAWKKENFTETAKRYTPLEKKYLNEAIQN